MTALYIVKAKKTFLKSPLSTTATTVILDELVDSQGNDIAMASFGEFGIVVLTQATTVEMIKFTNLSRNVNTGAVTLTVATNGRDIAPVTPYAGSSTGQRFNATADAIITNDPYTMMRFGLLNNANLWDLLQTFTITPKTNGGFATTSDGLVPKAQLDASILGIITSVSIVVEGTAGETLVDGNLVYLKSADGRWWKADADTSTTIENVILGIAQGAGTAGSLITNGIMLRGVDDAQTGLTAGAKYYASDTAGGISSSAGTVEVTVGVAKSTTELYFEPYFDQRLTEDQQDAMDNANSPSAGNPFLVQSDATATPTANKIAMFNSEGEILIKRAVHSYVYKESITAGDAVCLYPYQSDGGILKDTSGASGNGSTGQSITIGNNANRMLIVSATANDGATTPTATFGGIAMTALQTQGVTVLFYILAPATGAQTLLISTSCSYTYHSLYGVTQTAPEVSEKSTSNTTESITTISDGAMVFASIGSAVDNLTTWTISGQMGYYDAVAGGGNLGKTFSSLSGHVFTPQAVGGTMNTAGSGCNYVACVIAPATAPVYGGVFKASSATNALSQFADKYTFFVGIAKETGVLGETKKVTISGIAPSLTLTPHKLYYLNDTAGTYGITAGTNSKKIGQAHSTTELNVTQVI